MSLIPPVVVSPAEDSAQQRGVEALRRGEAPLHLPDRHLVLGGGAEQREATRDRTEDLRRVGHGPHAEALLPHGQGREARPIQFGRDRNWAEIKGKCKVFCNAFRLFAPFAHVGVIKIQIFVTPVNKHMSSAEATALCSSSPVLIYSVSCSLVRQQL